MLECRGLSVAYGQHRALDAVALRVAASEIVVMLGANGAGKSTLLNAVAGLVPCDVASQILMNGQALARRPPHEIVEAGLALVPEGRRIFGDLSVEENLLLGAYARRARQAERASLERVFALFPKLAERRAQVTRTMSGGEQQMVAIGRALMSAPSILMLDEPSLGLSPRLCSELFRALAAIRKTGVGILLVEQNARQALAIADRGYVLEIGRIVAEGAAAELARDPAVQQAYLGGAAQGAPTLAATAGPGRRPGGVPAARPGPASAAHGAIATAGRIQPAGLADASAASIPVAQFVRRAAEIDAAQVSSSRSAASGARPGIAGMPGVGESIAEALKGIEAAALRARAQPQPAVTGSGEAGATEHVGGNEHAGVARTQAEAPTVIEVWRRPLVEIYRREGKDGELRRVKGD